MNFSIPVSTTGPSQRSRSAADSATSAASTAPSKTPTAPARGRCEPPARKPTPPSAAGKLMPRQAGSCSAGRRAKSGDVPRRRCSPAGADLADPPPARTGHGAVPREPAAPLPATYHGKTLRQEPMRSGQNNLRVIAIRIREQTRHTDSALCVVLSLSAHFDMLRYVICDMAAGITVWSAGRRVVAAAHLWDAGGLAGPGGGPMQRRTVLAAIKTKRSTSP